MELKVDDLAAEEGLNAPATASQWLDDRSNVAESRVLAAGEGPLNPLTDHAAESRDVPMPDAGSDTVGVDYTEEELAKATEWLKNELIHTLKGEGSEVLPSIVGNVASARHMTLVAHKSIEELVGAEQISEVWHFLWESTWISRSNRNEALEAKAKMLRNEVEEQGVLAGKFAEAVDAMWKALHKLQLAWKVVETLLSRTKSKRGWDVMLAAAALPHRGGQYFVRRKTWNKSGGNKRRAEEMSTPSAHGASGSAGSNDWWSGDSNKQWRWQDHNKSEDQNSGNEPEWNKQAWSSQNHSMYDEQSKGSEQEWKKQEWSSQWQHAESGEQAQGVWQNWQQGKSSAWNDGAWQSQTVHDRAAAADDGKGAQDATEGNEDEEESTEDGEQESQEMRGRSWSCFGMPEKFESIAKRAKCEGSG
eukprot:6049813-Amphidinium_carterae.3